MMVTDRLAHIGRTLHLRIRDFFDAPLEATATPLEIAGAVLAEIERKVQPVGRGRRILPCNRIAVRVAAAPADRAALQAVFDGLEARVRERLREVACDAPEGLEVRVSLLEQLPDGWPPGRVFAVDYAAAPYVPPAPGPAPSLRTLQIAVLKGAATQEAYSFTQPSVSIGRTDEPTDEQGRVRRNHVVFLDSVDGITETVGRAHARLQLEPATREYRIYNEGSSNPAVIARDGAIIQVPARDPRGVRVRDGDEIHLGRAVIRVTFGPAPASLVSPDAPASG